MLELVVEKSEVRVKFGTLERSRNLELGSGHMEAKWFSILSVPVL
jgi:hypothetical protein